MARFDVLQRFVSRLLNPCRFLVEQDGIQFPANAITIPEERANRY